MSPFVQADQLTEPMGCPVQRDHASVALEHILDAEIEALKARLRQRSADAAVTWGPARASLDPQVGWLQDGVAKLQARRDALT